MSRPSPRRAYLAVFLVAALLLGLVAPALGSTSGLRPKPDPIKVALVKCRDLSSSGLRELDSTLARSLTLALSDSPRFTVVSPESEQAQWLVAAAVSEAKVAKNSGKVEVAVSAESLDAETGELVGRAIARADSGSARTRAERRILIKRAVEQASERAVIQLARAADVEATVIETQRAQYVRLDVGTRMRIHEGAEFKIFHRGEAVGRVRVMKAMADDSECHIVELQPDKHIDTGDRAKLLFAPPPVPKEKHKFATAGKILGALLLAGVLYVAFRGKHRHTAHTGGVFLVADPPAIAADGTSTTEITATVLDKKNNPVPHSGVHFTTDHGVITGEGRTDNDGKVTAILRSEPNPALAHVQARSGKVTATIDVPFQGMAAALTLTATPAAIVADGAATSRIDAEVRDAAGNTVADGTTVTFDTTLGTIEATATTVNGIASATLTSAQQAGTADVTATVNGLSQTITVTFVAGSLTIFLDTSVDTLPADGVSTLTVTATVRDSLNNPVPDNTEVRFTTTLGTIQGLAFTGTGGLPSGVAQVTLTSEPSAGVATITASSMGVSATATVTFVVAGNSILVSSSVPTLPADGVATATITAVVRDALNNPAPDGTVVSFTTTLGTITFTATTTDGVATATLTSEPTSGIATITASALGTTGTVTVEFQAGPGGIRIFLTAGKTQLAADGVDFTDIQATVLNASGNPVPPGTTVHFSTDRGGVQSPEVVTDAFGHANVRFTSDTTPGEARVTATSVGATAAVLILVQVGPPATLSVIATDPAIPADGVSTTIIRATVRDVNNGVADATLTSSLDPGLAHVVATTDGLMDSVDVTFAALTGAASIVLLADPVSIAADGVSTSQITATVRDVNNNPIPDAPTSIVFFTTTLGTITASQPTSGGIATATLISEPTPGIAQVTATSLGATAQVLVQFVGPPPAPRIVLTAADPTLPADGMSTTILTATVRDASNAPVPGDTVTFEAPAGRNLLSINPGDPPANSVTATTDLLGQATCILTADTTVGTVQLRATAASAPGEEGTANVEFLGLVITALTADPQEILVGGAQTSTITATLTDTQGQAPADGLVVRFTLVNAAGLGGATIGSGTTATAATVNGSCSVILTSGTVAGVAQIRAETILPAPFPNPMVTLNLVGIRADLPAGTIAVVLSDTSVAYNDLGSPINVTAQVKDQFSNPVNPNTPVNFEVLSVSGGASGTVTGTALTDADGLATAEFRPDAVSWGQVRIRAFTTGSGGATIEGQSGIITIVGPPDSIVLSTPALSPDFTGSERVAPSTSVQLQAEVRDSNGVTVADGTQIYFYLTAGTATISTPVTSTSSGIATTTLQTTDLGTLTVRAQSPPVAPVAISNTINIIVVGAAASVTLSATGTTLDKDGLLHPATETLTATVRDVNGQLVLDGTSITFATRNPSGTPTPTVALGSATAQTSGGAAATSVTATGGPVTPSTGTIEVYTGVDNTVFVTFTIEDSS